jgi:Signal transduction histidine kinase
LDIKLKKFRWKSIKLELVMALFASAGLTGIMVLTLCLLLILGSSNHSFAVFFFKHLFAFILAFFVLIIALIITFFLLLVKKKVNYLVEITSNLEIISNGTLDIHIPVTSYDELGRMADTVNHMAFQLKQSMEEERRLEKTKSDLITNMSHDLRTPLTSVLGYLDLIRNYETQEETLKKYAEIAHLKCLDLKSLMDELFEYTKFSNGDFILCKKRISLKELIEQVLIEFIPVFEEQGMEYRKFFCEEKVFIQADPVLFTRVFENLISNALKYGNSGKLVEVELRREEKIIKVRVISYGDPIPEADLPYIFEKFYKIDKARTSEIGNASSGLGLAIVKRIMELHNGTVTASSSKQNTVFELKLPLDEE